jgi:hypothetical protein
MSANRWEKNFAGAATYELYVKPLISGIGVLLVGGLVVWAGRRFGVVGSNGRDVLLISMICCILYFVFHLSAKVDMLKRTVDKGARHRDTKRLWLDETDEVTSDGQIGH